MSEQNCSKQRGDLNSCWFKTSLILLCFLPWSVKLHDNGCEKGLEPVMVNREDGSPGREKIGTKARGLKESLQSSRILWFEEVNFGLLTQVVYTPT